MTPKTTLWTIGLLILVTGCSPRSDPAATRPAGATTIGLSSTPLPPLSDASAAGTSGTTLFEKLPPARTGVDFINTTDLTNPRKHLFDSPFVTGGVAIGDVNGDGKPDLFLLSGVKGNKLFLQIAEFRFEDATNKAGLSNGNGWGAGAAMVNIDNDGDLNIYIANYDAPAGFAAENP